MQQYLGTRNDFRRGGVGFLEQRIEFRAGERTNVHLDLLSVFQECRVAHGCFECRAQCGKTVFRYLGRHDVGTAKLLLREKHLTA